MVINKKTSKIVKLSTLHDTFFSLKIVEIGFVGIVIVTSIISLHVTTESPIFLSKYQSILQSKVPGLQT